MTGGNRTILVLKLDALLRLGIRVDPIKGAHVKMGPAVALSLKTLNMDS